MRHIPSDPVTVHLLREDEARCVADALGSESAAVRRAERGWDVDVRPRSVSVVLSALRDCLGESGIPFAKVTIDAHTYVLELAAFERSAPPPRERAHIA